VSKATLKALSSIVSGVGGGVGVGLVEVYQLGEADP
jgi:hypothetical protein